MKQSLAHAQMFDYLLKKYRNQELFKEIQMVVEMDGKLWTGDFIHLEDCHIIETDWEDRSFSRVERTRDAINSEFDQKIQASNVNVSQNRIDAKIASLKTSEILYQEITNFIQTIEDDTTTLKPFLYNAYCLDTRVKLPFLAISKQSISIVSLTK
ncbi:hypothetical protein [Listeria sp. PSOL-1]|uniref:hypothetical protein n=1 Tax=Listeria sp. PSOL-1 TaxID=1844999 RepID=UPI0013CF9D43|nr:hypothetical protein [Listeria sp. PSOL-1]